MKKTPIPLAVVLFFWAGFVCSISFMEAWLKFQAPGVTLPIGLSIGKLIFTALNRMEWVFVLITVLLLLPARKILTNRFNVLLGSIVFILLIQTFLLLPALNLRAELIIAGTDPGGSPDHILFGIAEVGKVLILLYLGIYSMKLLAKKNYKPNQVRM